MKKLSIVSLLLVACLFALAQGSSWEKRTIDENLTISFPGSTTLIDTTVMKAGERWRIKAYKHETESSTFALIVTPKETNMNIDDKETWKKALAEMSKGASKSFSQKGFSCSSLDTTIDKIPCVKIVCRNENISLLNSYMFLVNDKLYSLQYAAIGLEAISADTDRLNSFLNSVHFKKENIKEMQFESKAYASGYKFGYLLGTFGMIAIVIIGVIFFVRRLKL